MNRVESQQVSWWSVHEFVSAAIQHADISSWPTAGTPQWCSLADGDPRKWAALYDAAQHWALRLDAGQEVQAHASKDVQSAADWSAIATATRSRAEFYAAKPWMKRRSA